MTDRLRLTWQQAFVRRVISLSAARWIFSLVSGQWWRERSADGVAIHLQVMQVWGPPVAGGFLDEDFSCCLPKCLTSHSRKRTVYFSPNQPTWKMKMKMKIRRMKRKMRDTVKSAKWRVEENQNNHYAWSMDDVMRTNILSQCHVRHWHECGDETRENVTCEGVLFTEPDGCSVKQVSLFLQLYLGSLVGFVGSLYHLQHLLNTILSSSHCFKEIFRGGRGDAYTLSFFDFSRSHHDSLRDTISWERVVKDDCVRSCLIKLQSFLLSKFDVNPIHSVLMFLPYSLLLPCKTRCI